MKNIKTSILVIALIAAMMLVSCATVEPEPEPVDEIVEPNKWDLVITGVDEMPIVKTVIEGKIKVPVYEKEGMTLDTIEDLNGRKYKADTEFEIKSDVYLNYTWSKPYTVTLVEKGPGILSSESYSVGEKDIFIIPEKYHEGLAIDTITDLDGKAYYFGSTLDNSAEEWTILYTWKPLSHEKHWTEDRMHRVYSSLLADALTAMEKMRAERMVREVPVVALGSVRGPEEELGQADIAGLFRELVEESGRAWAENGSRMESGSLLGSLAESVLDPTDRYIFSTDVKVEKHELKDSMMMKIYLVKATLEDPDTGTIIWSGSDDTVRITYEILDLEAEPETETAE